MHLVGQYCTPPENAGKRVFSIAIGSPAFCNSRGINGLQNVEGLQTKNFVGFYNAPDPIPRLLNVEGYYSANIATNIVKVL